MLTISSFYKLILGLTPDAAMFEAAQLYKFIDRVTAKQLNLALRGTILMRRRQLSEA